MFRNTFQSGLLSILYSIGSQPLQLFEAKVKNGVVKRITDEEIKSLVLEIKSSNVSTTYITCPKINKSLGIKMNYFVMVVKNMDKYFTFELEVMDDTQTKRRFRASNFQSKTRVKDFICTMPLRLESGWNHVTLNLADFTRRVYGTNYVETSRVTVNANCRLRRIYFADKQYTEDELPAEFKLYLPIRDNDPDVDSPTWNKSLNGWRHNWDWYHRNPSWPWSLLHLSYYKAAAHEMWLSTTIETTTVISRSEQKSRSLQQYNFVVLYRRWNSIWFLHLQITVFGVKWLEMWNSGKHELFLSLFLCPLALIQALIVVHAHGSSRHADAIVTVIISTTKSG